MNALIRVGAGIIGAALLVVAMVLHTIKPDLEATALDPIRTSGAIGAEITTPTFTVKATQVDVARSVKSSGILGQLVRTDGIFVIVQLQAKSNKEPFRMNYVRLETPGGFIYDSSDRTGVFASTDLEPLIWSKTVETFEIPKGRLAGARLVVRDLSLLPELSAEIAVDLGITETKAAAMIRSAPEGYKLPGS